MTTSTDRRQGVNSSIAIKSPVAVATTANITLSGTQTIDGVAVVADDRVLVKDQTDASENGIYDVSTSTWTRAPDFNGSYDIDEGTLIKVQAGGTVSGGSLYEVTTSGSITIGTTNLTIALFSAGQSSGTWTPVLSDGTNSATSSTAAGFYQKVGSLVHIKASLATSSLGSVSGDLRITGLPFTPDATTDSQNPIGIGFASGLGIGSGQSVSGYVGAGEAFIRLTLWDATTGTSNLQSGEWTADGAIFLDGVYHV